MFVSSKQKLANALEILLESRPLSSITVSDLVKSSDLSRQSFYNNFTDIYDFLYWTHAMHIKTAVDAFHQQHDSFYQAFICAMQIMQSHKKFYQQIIQKDGYNSFQRLFALHNIEACRIHITQIFHDSVDEKTEFLLTLYWHGTAQMIVEWINHGMKQDPAILAKYLYQSLPPDLLKYWPK